MVKIFVRMAVVTMSAFVAIGCSQADRTVDDYENAKRKETLSQYKAIEGKYTGLLYSSGSDRASVISGAVRPIGAFSIDLRARLSSGGGQGGGKDGSSSGPSASSGKPILVSEMTVLLADHPISFAAPDAFYEPDDGLFQSDIKVVVKRPDGTEQAETISITSRVGDGQIQGTIQSLGYSEYGSSFTLVRGGKSLEQLLIDAHLNDNPGSGREGVLRSFTGVTHFAKGPFFKPGPVDKPMQMVVLQPRMGSLGDLVDLLIPVKTVQVSFNYGGRGRLTVTDSTWDIRTGMLSGRASVTDNNLTTTISFECKTSGRVESLLIDCDHFTSQRGLVATSKGKIDVGQVPEPEDRTGTNAAQDKIFTGLAMNFNSRGPRKTTIHAVYPTRSPAEDILNLFLPQTEIIIQVTWVYNLDLGFSIAFSKAQWNTVTGTLDAINDSSGISPGLPGASPGWVPKLHCDGFFFMKTSGTFDCTYSSNRTDTVNLKMKYN